MATNLQNFDKFATTYFHNTAAREWLILRMEVLSVLVFAGCMLLIVAMPRELIDSSKLLAQFDQRSADSHHKTFLHIFTVLCSLKVDAA